MKRKRIRSSVGKDNISTRVTDNTAASTGNRGTIHIGKGADDSITTKLELRDSTISINLNTRYEEEKWQCLSHTPVSNIKKVLTYAVATTMTAGLIFCAVRAISFIRDRKQ